MRHATFAVCTFGALLFAQETPPPPQPAAKVPRIGLVLSGGGARGTAHVGVLQVLEELRIPIHCVAGTSMGAIVGGCYAYGTSPAALRQLVTREGLPTKWKDILRDGGPYRDQSFRRKEEWRTYLAGPKIGFRDGSFRLPKGMLQGQNLEIELRILSLRAHDMRSFDDLPLPFRCTAVDIHTGELVVLDRGNLADAMRASMSLPGIFAPTIIDGRELVDGGLASNVPIDLGRAMGADVLIVVDIGTPVDTKRHLGNVLDVTSQMVAVLTQQNVDLSLRQVRKEDVLIRPELGDITSADFERAAEAIAIGRAATEAVAERLKQWSVPAAQYDAWLARQRRTAEAAPPRLRTLTIDNNSSVGDTMLRERLHVEPGEPIDGPRFRRDLDEIYGIDDFQRVRFDLTKWDGDLVDLHLGVEEKDWGPSFARFGLALQSDREQSTYQLAGMLVVRGVNRIGAEWRNAIELGNRDSIVSELYVPVVQSGLFFFAPRVFGRREEVSLFADGEKIAEQQSLYGGAGVDLGVSLGSSGEIRLGYERITGETDVGLASQPIPDEEFDSGVLRLRLALDTFNAPYFASDGIQLEAAMQQGHPAFGSDDEYTSTRLAAEYAVEVGGVTFRPGISWDGTVAGTRPTYAEPTLGGFTRLSGLPADSLRGQHSALARLGVHVLAIDSMVPVHIGGTVEYGNVWQRRDDVFDDPIAASSVFAACETPLGPLFLGFGCAEGGESTAFLFLGRGL